MKKKILIVTIFIVFIAAAVFLYDMFFGNNWLLGKGCLYDGTEMKNGESLITSQGNTIHCVNGTTK